jgi:predicted anti-sigma-YlaC factor YlaD
MNEELKPEMRCAEFEAMLAEAVEGRLGGQAHPAFAAHHATCSRCASLYAEAELGWRWLKALQSEETVPPPDLIENILCATSRAGLPGAEARPSWWRRVRELPVWGPLLPAVLQPRLALVLAMVFVAMSAIFSFTGRQLRDLYYADLSPTILQHDFYEAQGKVMRYYDNIRFASSASSAFDSLLRRDKNI